MRTHPRCVCMRKRHTYKSVFIKDFQQDRILGETDLEGGRIEIVIKAIILV